MGVKRLYIDAEGVVTIDCPWCGERHGNRYACRAIIVFLAAAQAEHAPHNEGAPPPEHTIRRNT